MVKTGSEGVSDDDLIRYEMRETGLDREKVEDIFEHPDVRSIADDIREDEATLEDLDAMVKTVILGKR